MRTYFLALLLCPAAASAQTDPAQYWLERGVAFREAGALDDALHAFEHACQIHPTSRAYAYVGETAAELGAWARAAQTLAWAIDRPDEYVTAHRVALEALLARAQAELPPPPPRVARSLAPPVAPIAEPTPQPPPPSQNLLPRGPERGVASFFTALFMPSLGFLVADEDYTLDDPEIWVFDVAITVITPFAVWGAIEGNGEALFYAWGGIIISALSRLVTAIVVGFVAGQRDPGAIEF